MAKKSNKANLSIEEMLEQAKIVSGYEPYKIPQNWCWIKLGAVCTLDKGETNSSENLTYFDAKTLRADKEIDVRNSGVIVKKGQKVILVDGENSGEVFVIPYRGYMGSTFRILNISNNIDDTFIQYFIDYNTNKLKSNKIGSAIPHLNKELFYELELPLSPLFEQRRIVERIEALFLKLDEVKEKAQDVFDSFETRKASILNDAFSGNLTEKWRKKYKIGLDSWKNSLISECCKLGSGGTPSRRNDSYYTGNIPWIKTGEINWNVVNDSEEKITQEAIENSSAKIYEPGVVLVAMYGMGITRGKAAILGVKATTNQAVCVLQTNENLYNRYLFYFFMSNYWNIREQAVGGNQLNLSVTIIGKLNIVIPKLEEQKEIVKILDNFIDKERNAAMAAKSIIEHIDLMKKSILSKAFRGELGTNNPNDENAEESLKRILSEKAKEANEQPKVKRTRIVIPEEVENLLQTNLEREIIKLFYKSETKEVPEEDVMSVSSRAFDNLDAVQSLEEKKLIKKSKDGIYKLLR